MTIHSIQEVSSICDEKGENSVLQIRENNLKFFVDRSNVNKSIDPPASYNVSVDDLDSPVQVLGEPMLLEKKFITTCPTISSKSLKNNNTRDTSVYNDIENTIYLPKAPLNRRKFSIKKEANTFDAGLLQDHKEGDFEEGIVSEFSVDTNFFSPRNIQKYETKVFSNPHHRVRLGEGTRKFLTEYLETSPDKFSRSYASNLRERNSFYNTFGMDNSSLPDPVEHYIPCLVLRARSATNKIILYFHGNGEDIHLARELLTHVRDHLNVRLNY